MKRGAGVLEEDKTSNKRQKKEIDFLVEIIQHIRQGEQEEAIAKITQCSVEELNTVVKNSYRDEKTETTLLAEAVEQKNLALIECLIDKGADIHIEFRHLRFIESTAIFKIFNDFSEEGVYTPFGQQAGVILNKFIEMGANLFNYNDQSILYYFNFNHKYYKFHERTLEEYQALAHILGDNFYTHLLHVNESKNALTQIRGFNVEAYQSLLSQSINYLSQKIEDYTFQTEHLKLLKNLLITTHDINLIKPLIQSYCSQYPDDIPLEVLSSPLVHIEQEDILTDFPCDEVWRLFVDADKQKDPEENGWQGYETRELRCIQNAWEAFVYVIKGSHQELDFDTYHQTHEYAAKDLRKEIRNHNTYFRFILDVNLTLEGFLELISEDKLVKDNYIRHNDIDDLEVSFLTHSYEDTCEKEIINNVKMIIAHYNGVLSRVGEDRIALLKNIIFLASNLDKCHPYHDGNTRTAYIILNRELYKHKFPLVIFDNPNQMDGFSQNQLFVKVLQGMQNYMAIKNGELLPGALSNESILENLQKTKKEALTSSSSHEGLDFSSFMSKRFAKKTHNLEVELPLIVSEEQKDCFKLKKKLRGSGLNY